MTTTMKHRVMQTIIAGAATIAMLAAYDAPRPRTAESVVTSGSVRLVDQAAGVPAPRTFPFGPQFPQVSPNVVDQGGFAADDDDDQGDQDERNQIAQQTEEEWDDYWAQDEDPNVNNPNNP